MVDKVDFNDLQIIHAGFHRTGTASLSIALNDLGFGPVWHSATTPEIDPILAGKCFNYWTHNNIMKRLNNGEKINFQEWLNIIKCKTVMDFPINFYWEQLYNQYPNTKVILSIRDFNKWYDSNIFLVDRCCSAYIVKYFGIYVDKLWDMIVTDYYGFHYHNNISRLLNKNNKELLLLNKHHHIPKII